MQTKAIYFFSLLFSFLAIQSCTAQNWYGSKVSGEGPIVTRSLDIPSFEGIHLTLPGEIYLRQGNVQSVEVQGQDNIIALLEREVNGGVWKIKTERGVRNAKKLKFHIVVPNLREVKVSGSGDIKSENTFRNLGDLRLEISGSGDIQFEFEGKEVEARISGSGDMELEGSAQRIGMSISGSGDIDALDLVSEEASIRISGSGDVSIHCQEMLEVRTSGSGDVHYRGQPRVSSKISGSGNLVSVGNN